MTKESRIEETVKNLKNTEARLKEYEKLDLIRDYKNLLIKKELLLCEYTFLQFKPKKKSL